MSERVMNKCPGVTTGGAAGGAAVTAGTETGTEAETGAGADFCDKTTGAPKSESKGVSTSNYFFFFFFTEFVKKNFVCHSFLTSNPSSVSATSMGAT